MKKVGLALVLAMMVIGFLACTCDARDIGNIVVNNKIMGKDRILIKSFVDPQMPWISITLTSIKCEYSTSSPSDNSVSARAWRNPKEDEKLIKKSNPSVICLSKSIGAKKLKIARLYNKYTQEIVYVTYSTKIISGSYKHSTSVVPVGHLGFKVEGK